MSNTIYCTYLTTYSGDKLPPLYIGSTSVQKIKEGYHGSVKSKKYRKTWESELSNNPHLFETKILTTHSTREEALEEEIRYQIEHDVVSSDLYVNMAIANKKFIFNDHDLEWRKKISEAGIKRYKNPDERKKTSDSIKKLYESEEARKKTSDSIKKLYENGFIPPFFGKKHSNKTKSLIAEANKNLVGPKNGSYGRNWFYNPETLENIKCLPEDKPENFIPGRKVEK